MIISAKILIYSTISILLHTIKADRERDGDVRFTDTNADIEITHIPNSTSAELRFRRKIADNHNLKFNKWSNYKWRVTYWPLATELLMHALDPNSIDDCSHSVDAIGLSGQQEMEHCHADVFGFGRTDDDIIAPLHKQLIEKCGSKQVDLIDDTTLTLTDLWPFCKYAFHYEVMNEANHTMQPMRPITDFPFCMPRYYPLAPPQTDNSSFELELGKRGDRMATLYWRPLPHLFYGDSYINITIVCLQDHDNSLFHKNLFFNNDIGKYKLPDPIPNNHSITCEFRALNSVGPSSSSYIRIPKQENIVHIATNFTLEEANYSKGIQVRWNDIIYPQVPNAVFTLYWCHKTISLGCNNFMGLSRTRRFEQKVRKVWGKDNSTYQYRFGISVQLPDGKSRSGIFWSRDCDKLETMGLPLELTTLEALKSETGVHLVWRVGNCGKSPLIDYYQVQYCFVDYHHPCTSMSSYSWDNYANNSDFSTKNCDHRIFDNDLNGQFNLLRLESHSYYRFRLRYHVPFHDDSRQWSNWSDTAIGTTAHDTARSVGCAIRVLTSVLIICPLLTTVAYYLYLHFRLRGFGRPSPRTVMRCIVKDMPVGMLKKDDKKDGDSKNDDKTEDKNNTDTKNNDNNIVKEEEKTEEYKDTDIDIDEEEDEDAKSDGSNTSSESELVIEKPKRRENKRKFHRVRLETIIEADIPYILPECTQDQEEQNPENQPDHDNQLIPLRDDIINSEMYASESNDTDEEAFIDGVMRNQTSEEQQAFLPNSN